MRLLQTMTSLLAAIVLVWSAVFLGGAVGCGRAAAELPAIKGRVRGTLLRTTSRTEIRAIDFPSRKESVIYRTRSPADEVYPTIHALSGPDRQGRIAVIKDHFFDAPEDSRRHELIILDPRGKEIATLFTQSGSAMWAASPAGKGEIGAEIALSPVGGKVALLTGLVGKQMPRALLREGRIEVWDIETKKARRTNVKALDRSLSWFPDGNRLAFVAFVARKDLPANAPGLEQFGEYFGERWDEIPAVHILDVKSGKATFVCVGWSVVAPCEGETIAVGGWGREAFRWMRMDLKTGETTPLQFDDGPAEVIAVLSDRLMLYQGFPTSGSVTKKEIRSADSEEESDSRSTIKVGDCERGVAALVVKGIGRWDQASFGVAKP